MGFHRLLELVLRRDRIGVGLQPLRSEGRAIEAEMHLVPRQQVRGRRKTCHRRRPVRRHRLPVLVAEERSHVVDGRGDLVQETRIVEAGEAGQACSVREAAEAEIGHRKRRRIVGGTQRAQRRIALGVSPAPVVDDADRVRVRLGVDAVDDQHHAVILLEERLVAGEGGIGDVAGLADLVALRPVVDDLLARCIGLGVAEAGGVPAAIGLNEDVELAGIVCGMDQRQAEARRRSGILPGRGRRRVCWPRSLGDKVG